MASTGYRFPSAATGWTFAERATSNNNQYAYRRSYGFSSPTPNLVLSGFGLAAGGHATGITARARIKAYSEGGASFKLYLARNGVAISNVVSVYEPSTSVFEAMLPVWQATLSDNDVRNLQVVVFANGLLDGFCYVDYVSVNVTYPDTDAVPNVFSFGSDPSVPFNSTRTSASIIVAGVAAPSSVSVANGELERNGNGVWQATDTTASNGDAFKVRHVSASTGNAAKTTTLTIGGVSAGFTSTTEPTDQVPDAVTLAAVTNSELSTPHISNEVTISGINTPCSILAPSGEYQINGGAWTSVSGTVKNGDKVKVRRTSSPLFGTLISTNLQINGVTLATFAITTKAGNSTPTPFFFTHQEGVAASTLRTSNTVTVAGLDGGVNVSITSGEYSKNGGAWASTATTAVNGDTFAVRHTSAAGATTSVITWLTVGQYVCPFASATTGGDLTPVALSYTPIQHVGMGRDVTSNAPAISGINVSTPVHCVNGLISVNGGGFVGNAAITTGQTLAVRVVSGAHPLFERVATVYVGNTSQTFSVQTASAHVTDI
jgi:hypothetical protein